jgi:hypothetical protein
VPVSVFGPARALLRRAALDDLAITLTLMTWALRILRYAARTWDERRFAGRQMSVLEEAGRYVEQL